MVFLYINKEIFFHRSEVVIYTEIFAKTSWKLPWISFLMSKQGCNSRNLHSWETKNSSIFPRESFLRKILIKFKAGWFYSRPNAGRITKIWKKLPRTLRAKYGILWCETYYTGLKWSEVPVDERQMWPAELKKLLIWELQSSFKIDQKRPTFRPL